MKSYDVTEWGRPLQARLRDTPVPKGREVLLRLTHCGVCHSDIHVRDGYFDLGGGSCRLCAANRDNLCANMRALGIAMPGGFATHLLIPDPRYLVNVDGLDPARAAPLACSGVTTYSAVKKLQPIDPEDWVAVIGCGGLGLMALAVLRGLGHERVIACDIDDGKLAVARERGAKATCNLKSEGLKRLGELAPGGIYGMLDFVGMREIAILGSAVGTTQEIKELVDLVKQGRVQLPEVERRPLAMAEQSLADLAAGKVRGRVVLEMQGEG